MSQSTVGMIPGPNNMYWPRNLQQRVAPPNWFNGCLQKEQDTWKAINDFGGLKAICPGKIYFEPPWVKMPQQGRRYSKIGSIPLPANDGTDNPVVFMDGKNYFIVPYGYDGCIVSVVFSYVNGVTNLQEGSGDLTWRLLINQRYQRDFGNVTVEIGSLQTPYNVNSGQILLLSGQRVQILVSNSTTSTLSGGRVIGACFGWFYPR